MSGGVRSAPREASVVAVGEGCGVPVRLVSGGGASRGGGSGGGGGAGRASVPAGKGRDTGKADGGRSAGSGGAKPQAGKSTAVQQAEAALAAAVSIFNDGPEVEPFKKRLAEIVSAKQQDKPLTDLIAEAALEWKTRDAEAGRLRAELKETVNPADIESEIARLIEALAR